MQPTFPEEYRALREAAGVLDRSERGRVAAVGRDRLGYLHAMLTNDIAVLRPGAGCYAMYLTPQGRIITDMVVLELGDLTLLDIEPGHSQELVEKLEQFIFSEDVQLSDLGSRLAEIAVCGPHAAGALQAALENADGAGSARDFEALADYGSMRRSFNGASAVVAADRGLAVPVFSVYLDREQAGAFVDTLLRAGAMRVSAEALDTLRIEAGRPRYGIDMDETTIPLEAGVEHRAISFTKGCYPGQEVITRVLHRGHGRVAKRLVGFNCELTVPTRGDKVMAAEREIGHVTSATTSPAMQVPIALGYVQRDFVQPGTAVSIVHDEGVIAAVVTDLPFVRPSS